MGNFCRTNSWHSALILMAFSAYIGALAFATPEPCGSSTYYSVMETSGSFIYFSPLAVTVVAKNASNGEPIPDFGLTVYTGGITESVLVPNVLGPGLICQSFTALFFSDPTLAYFNDTGTGVQSFNFTRDGWCSFNQTRQQLTATSYIELVSMSVTWPQYPQFSAVLAFGVLFGQENFTTASYSASSTTKFLPLNYGYIDNKLKWKLDVYNWPWAASGQSMLSVYAYVSHNGTISDPNLISQPMNINITYDPTEFGVSIGYGAFEGQVRFDFSTVLDGVPYLLTRDNTSLSAVPSSIDGIPILIFPGIWLLLSMCNEDVGLVGQHYSHLWWDPTLSVLFNPPQTPSATPLNPSQKKNQTVLIALVVTFPLLILIVVAGIVAAYCWSPRFRTMVSPFLKREVRGAHGLKGKATLHTIRHDQERQSVPENGNILNSNSNHQMSVNNPNTRINDIGASETIPSVRESTGGDGWAKACKPDSGPNGGWAAATKPSLQ